VAKEKRAEEKSSRGPNAAVKYWRETRGELRKVTWPTREESLRLTGIVLGVTIAFAAFLWVFDSLFSNGLRFLIEALV
jgi:preprotein translocase subunit SecE